MKEFCWWSHGNACWKKQLLLKTYWIQDYRMQKPYPILVKMTKIDTLFPTKTAEKPYPVGPPAYTDIRETPGGEEWIENEVISFPFQICSECDIMVLLWTVRDVGPYCIVCSLHFSSNRLPGHHRVALTSRLNILKL